MKAQRLVFVKIHLKWTTAKRRKVSFCDKLTLQQVTSSKRLAEILVGHRKKDRYTVQTVKLMV